jgi:transcriptional regulator with XRE-family HTH domain
MRNYSKLIEAILEKYHLNKTKLANELGISSQFMSRILNQNVPLPDTYQKKLIEKYNINPAYFFDESAPMFQDEQKEAIPERPEWLQKLTPDEELRLQELTEKDKELLLLFFGACSGDKQKIKLFCQYLSSKYGVKLD